MKLNPDAQIELNDSVIEETSRIFPVQPRSWSAVEEGIGNVVAKIVTSDNDIVYAKYYNAAHAYEQIVDEALLMGHISPQIAPTPSIVPSEEHHAPIGLVHTQQKKHWVMMTRELPGSHPKTYSQTLVAQLAMAHAGIHATSIKQGAGRELDISTDYRYADTLQVSGAAAVEHTAQSYLEDVTAASKLLPKGLAHLDIARGNVLVQDDVLTGIIDFEDTRIAPYAFCLAGTIWDIQETTGDSSLASKYLEAYQEKRELTTLESGMLDKLVFLRGWISLHGALLTQGLDNVALAKLDMLTAQVPSPKSV